MRGEEEKPFEKIKDSYREWKKSQSNLWNGKSIEMIISMLCVEKEKPNELEVNLTWEGFPDRRRR